MLHYVILINAIWQLLGPPTSLKSLQPVATYETIVADPRFAGTWQQGSESLLIERVPDSKILKTDKGDSTGSILGDSKEEKFFNERAYIVSAQQQGIDYIMLGSMSRIGGRLFVDITALGVKGGQGSTKGSGFEFNDDYCHLFNIAAVEFSGDDSMTIRYLDGAFIKDQVLKGYMHLKYEQDKDFGSFVLTASSFEWRQFLEKYGRDKRLYSKEGSLFLTRKK